MKRTPLNRVTLTVSFELPPNVPDVSDIEAYVSAAVKSYAGSLSADDDPFFHLDPRTVRVVYLSTRGVEPL